MSPERSKDKKDGETPRDKRMSRAASGKTSSKDKDKEEKKDKSISSPRKEKKDKEKDGSKTHREEGSKTHREDKEPSGSKTHREHRDKDKEGFRKQASQRESTVKKKAIHPNPDPNPPFASLSLTLRSSYDRK